MARLREMAMVFQDPLTYLNPVLTVGSQIIEILETDRRVFTPVVVAARLEELEKAARGGSLTEEESREKSRLEALPSHEALGRREFKRLAKAYAVAILGKRQAARAREDVQDVSLRAVRRDAPEGDDSDGARQEAGPPHRRRDNDRARCDRPGSDPQAARRSSRPRSTRRSSSSPTTSRSSRRCATGWP